MKKITIITVIKNNKKGIEKTIKSVLSQTIINKVEYIVIDSNSKDGTSKIISKFKKKLLHIRENDSGIYDGINKGIKNSKGKYIGLLHSGDQFFDKISLQKALFEIEKFKLDAASFSMVYKNNNKIVRLWKMNVNKITKFNFFKIAHPTLIVKKNIFKNNLYNTKYVISADTEFLTRLTKIKNISFRSFDLLLQICQYGGISTNKKFFILKTKEDLDILYKRFSYQFPLIYLYKIFCKIPGYFLKK
jgi:glycosyltransferase involved in cell wall biosynthesis